MTILDPVHPPNSMIMDNNEECTSIALGATRLESMHGGMLKNEEL